MKRKCPRWKSMDRCQIWVVSKCLSCHLRVQIQEQGWQELTRGWSGESRHILRVISFHGAAWESPRFHCWGYFWGLNLDPRHMQCYWMASVSAIYFPSLHYEMEKDSCCLPSCESFIGWQVRTGQTLGSSGGQRVEVEQARIRLPAFKPGWPIHRLR